MELGAGLEKAKEAVAKLTADEISDLQGKALEAATELQEATDAITEELEKAQEAATELQEATAAGEAAAIEAAQAKVDELNAAITAALAQ